MARPRGSRLNLLGVLSILLAVAAFVATRISIAGYKPIQIANISIAVGVLGFVLSLITRWWGSGTPVLGIVLALCAIGWVTYSDGRLPAWWARMHPAPAGTTTSGKPAPSTAMPPSSESSGPHNIFTNPGASTPADNMPSPGVPDAAPKPPPAPEIPSPSVTPSITPPVTLSVADARSKLDSAITAVERSLASDSEYVEAKKAVDAADAKRKAAISSAGPGSDVVLIASNQWLNAKSQLKKLIEAAAAKDPAVQAAQRDLKDAEANARSSKPVKH